MLVGPRAESRSSGEHCSKAWKIVDEMRSYAGDPGSGASELSETFMESEARSRARWSELSVDRLGHAASGRKV